MLTFAEILQDPTILDSFTWEQAVELQCSGCGGVTTPKKYHVLRAVKAGRTTYFCSRPCTNHARLLAAIVERQGVPGRVCVVCTMWTPLVKMTAKGRGRVCMKCKREEPGQRFAILKAKAKLKGWPFTLTETEFGTFLGRPCFYCGDPMTGLDRVNSLLGYQTGNVVAACGACNFGKSNMGQADFLAHCRRIVAFQVT